MSNDKPWTVESEEALYEAPPWIRLSKQALVLPNGRRVDDFHQLALPDFVATVAMTGDGRLVLIRQYKHGVGETTLTLPGGMVERNEPPQQAARRELLEETGYEARHWAPLGSFTVHGNLGAGQGHFFKAVYAKPIQEPHSGDLEDMEIVLMTRSEVETAIASGEVALLNHAAGLALAGFTASTE